MALGIDRRRGRVFYRGAIDLGHGRLDLRESPWQRTSTLPNLADVERCAGRISHHNHLVGLRYPCQRWPNDLPLIPGQYRRSTRWRYCRMTSLSFLGNTATGYFGA